MEDWEYFRFSPECKMELLPTGDGRVQLVVPVSPSINTE